MQPSRRSAPVTAQRPENSPAPPVKVENPEGPQARVLPAAVPGLGVHALQYADLSLNFLVVLADLGVRAQDGVDRAEHLAHALFGYRTLDDNDELRLVQ